MPFKCFAEVIGTIAKRLIRLGQKLLPLRQPCRETLLEVGRIEQGEQGGRQAHRQLRLAIRTLGCPLKGFQQGEITLNQCLEKPVFLQRPWFCRTDVRQMGVQNKGDSAFGQRSTVLIPKFSLVPSLK
jgi:hypothetical protein